MGRSFLRNIVNLRNLGRLGDIGDLVFFFEGEYNDKSAEIDNFYLSIL